MARILYGVAGEGSGHSSRAEEIIRYLESKNHHVKVISHDRGYKNLSPSFDVAQITGLRFAYKDNQIQALPTIYKNLINSPGITRSIDEVIRIVDTFKPSIVFSDFEPISCWVANLKKLPLISIDNQHRLTNTETEYPGGYQMDALAAKAVVNLMIFNSRACLVTAFSRTKILNHKTFLFPPILRREVLEMKPEVKDFILVYLTTQFSGITDLLHTIKKRFVVYGFDRNDTIDHVTYKKADRAGFIKDLALCSGVVATAGFTLITEALHLHKPYLAVPVGGQFEQIYNAYMLDKLGYGKFCEKLSRTKIEDFLSSLESYRENLNRYKREDNTEIFRKIDELIHSYAEK